MSSLEYLKKYWGHTSFRPPQDDIIQHALERKDTLVLLPTGGGKSICFQIPALMTDGICIVVSPLIALIKDQVEQLNNRGIKAAAIFSGMKKTEIDITLDNCVYGNFKFLYVSPERLKTPIFLERSRKMSISYLVIDEAHCISQWGYDFRPPYLEILAFKNTLPNITTMALTASATEVVKEDIINKLLLSKPVIFTSSFGRSNLSYSAFELQDKQKKLIDILKSVNGTAIIYCKSRKTTENISKLISSHGLSATYYHAGLSNEVRSNVQHQWITNKVRVIVSTNAFGMGIDKPDVRLVVHYDIPDSIEAYYQEAGRAGRDEKKAFAVLLYQRLDFTKQAKYVEERFPSADQLKHLYQCLSNYYKLAIGSGELSDFDFDIDHFCRIYELSALTTYNGLKRLQGEGLVQLTENYVRSSKIRLLIGKSDLYAFQIANEQFDPLIKAMLRLFGGELFTGFVTPNYQQLSQLSQLSPSDIRGKLVYLHKHQVLEYIAANQRPQVTFLTPRLDAKTLPLNKKLIEERKKVALEKMKAMQHYAANDQTCKTRLIQEYFGEKTYTSCGICDICLSKKRESNSQEKIDSMKAEIMRSKTKWVDQLQEKLDSSGDTFSEALRQLVHEEKINVDFNGKISFLD